MRKKGKKNIYAFIITSIVIVAILQLKIGVQNVWTIIYYITAYFGSSFRKNIVSNKKAYFMIIFAIIMRLFMKYVLGIYDKFYVLNLLYENIIVPILQWILGIGIFFTIYYMSIRYYDSLKYINKQVKKIDSMSYYIYIVHYMFLVGELSVIKLMGNLFLGMGVFIVFTVIYALIIKKITDYIVDRRK